MSQFSQIQPVPQSHGSRHVHCKLAQSNCGLRPVWALPPKKKERKTPLSVFVGAHRHQAWEHLQKKPSPTLPNGKGWFSVTFVKTTFCLFLVVLQGGLQSVRMLSKGFKRKTVLGWGPGSTSSPIPPFQVSQRVCFVTNMGRPALGQERVGT